MVKCTVAIPVYNRPQLIRQSLESALAQDAADLEILVIDNASTDETWDVLQSYSDPRLRLIRNDHNIGLFGNLNRCLELAQGEYVLILCSDDRLVPGCISEEMALLRANPGVDMLSTQGRQVDPQNRFLRTFADMLQPGIYSLEDAVVGGLWYMSHYEASPYNYPSGVMLRRQAALDAGGFDCSLTQLGDLDLWLKIARKGWIAITDTFGCEVLVHPEQTTNVLMNQGEIFREWFHIVQRYAQELKARDQYKAVFSQTAAVSLWWGVAYLRKRRWKAAGRYWRTGLTQGLPLWTLAFAFVRHAWYSKVLLRGFQVLLRAPVSFTPLVKERECE